MLFPDLSLIPALFGVVGAILGAIAGGYATFRIEKLKIKNLDASGRKQLFSKLMGHKVILSQIYFSRYEAYIYYQIEKMKWYLAGAPDDSPIASEADRLLRKSEDLAIEIAKQNQKLFETIGLIQTNFNNISPINDLIDQMSNVDGSFRASFELEYSADEIDIVKLDCWVVEKHDELKRSIEEKIESPIERALVQLINEIKGQD